MTNHIEKEHLLAILAIFFTLRLVVLAAKSLRKLLKGKAPFTKRMDVIAKFAQRLCRQHHAK